MALNGHPANVHPETAPWANEVERELAELKKQLASALSELRAR